MPFVAGYEKQDYTRVLAGYMNEAFSSLDEAKMYAHEEEWDKYSNIKFYELKEVT
jgi:hypothetical protein